MLRVLEEFDRAAAGFQADPVHDLRVALRRCRSMADGMKALDPNPAWKAMKKAGKKIFQSLGDLRDTQVMSEWIERLAPAVERPTEARPSGAPAPASAEHLIQGKIGLAAVPADTTDEPGQDPVGALRAILRQRETGQKHAARAALEQFDRKQWRQWSKSLPLRAARIRPGSAVFKHLALERWMMARELHTRAMRSRSQVTLHTLRIGIKRFRYIVENFLPDEHRIWSGDLKHMQDLLGEVHDLDVLWATSLSCQAFHDPESRRRWHERITEERAKRIDEYRNKMIGPDSLWNVWRAGLPQGKRIQQIATQRIKLWAKALDPDFAHSERIAHLALELYDGLQATRLLGRNISGASANAFNADERPTLYISALLHDVGKSRGNKGHHKESQAMIQSHPPPLGWNTSTMDRAAVIARFHAGTLPTRGHKLLRDLSPNDRETILRLSAILRLANAFDAEHDGRIRRVKVEDPFAQGPASSATNTARNGLRPRPAPLLRSQAVRLEVDGYLAASVTAQSIAAERYLLELVLKRPVLVETARESGRGRLSKQPSAAPGKPHSHFPKY